MDPAVLTLYIAMSVFTPYGPMPPSLLKYENQTMSQCREATKTYRTVEDMYAGSDMAGRGYWVVTYAWCVVPMEARS